MAYLQFEHIQGGSAGGAVTTLGPSLDTLERAIVRMSFDDDRSSLTRAGRLARIGTWLSGLRRKGGLANPRLEALRRYAILYRLSGQDLDTGEDLAVARAGFDPFAIGEVRQLVDRHRAGNGRAARRWFRVALLGLALIGTLSGMVLLIQQATDDIAISTMIAALIFVTMLSHHRPAHQ